MNQVIPINSHIDIQVSPTALGVGFIPVKEFTRQITYWRLLAPEQLPAIAEIREICREEIGCCGGLGLITAGHSLPINTRNNPLIWQIRRTNHVT